MTPKEYEQFKKHFGDKSDAILFHLYKKGNLNEIKRTKIFGTVRTSQNLGGSVGNRESSSKIIPPKSI